MENKQTTQNGTAGAVRTARARALDVAYVGMAAAARTCWTKYSDTMRCRAVYIR